MDRKKFMRRIRSKIIRAWKFTWLPKRAKAAVLRFIRTEKYFDVPFNPKVSAHMVKLARLTVSKPAKKSTMEWLKDAGLPLSVIGLNMVEFESIILGLEVHKTATFRAAAAALVRFKLNKGEGIEPQDLSLIDKESKYRSTEISNFEDLWRKL